MSRNASSSPRRLWIGTRDSQLALIQARHVASSLSAAYPQIEFPLQTVLVRGDVDKLTPFLLFADKLLEEKSLLQAGPGPSPSEHKQAASNAAKMLWTEEMEMMLGEGELDILVHSLKDMPTTLPAHCVLGAVMQREDPTDALVLRQGCAPVNGLEDLPPGSVVGTSSTRRKALLSRFYPGLIVKECRGNVDTRLRKLDNPNGEYTCLILATAGLVRLGLAYRITCRLSPLTFPYAVGQGALGIEVRKTDTSMAPILSTLQARGSSWTCLAERSLLRYLQGGCSSPIGVASLLYTEDIIVDGRVRETQTRLRLYGMVVHPHGWTDIRANASMAVTSDEDAEMLGQRVAQMLLANGAAEILEKIRGVAHAGFATHMENTFTNGEGAGSPHGH